MHTYLEVRIFILTRYFLVYDMMHLIPLDRGAHGTGTHVENGSRRDAEKKIFKLDCGSECYVRMSE